MKIQIITIIYKKKIRKQNYNHKGKNYKRKKKNTYIIHHLLIISPDWNHWNHWNYGTELNIIKKEKEKKLNHVHYHPTPAVNNVVKCNNLSSR